MKNRRLIFLLLLGYSLITSTESFSQVYSTIEDGLYEIDSYTETLTSYNPPHANIYRGGFLMSVPKFGLRVTNNNIETDPADVHYTGGMKLRIYAPRVNASRSASEEPLPVIVFGYGGGFLNSWDITKTHKVPQYLARRGYIVVAPQYRIGIDLYNTALAERAIGRAVQDIRVVNKYARTLTNAKYTVDQTKPLTYVGWSSGAFIGLHNLYLRDSNQPASTLAGYEAPVTSNKYPDGITATTYSIGTLDVPWMGTSPQPPSSTEDPVQDITVSISGALGKLEWIVGAEVPKALYMIHHPTDAVVPFGTDEAYYGFSLFSKKGWVYPRVNGSNVINNFFANTPNLTPGTYLYKYMDPNCATDDCLKGDAGGKEGPLGKETWYHDPMENSANIEVMTSIIDFIELATIEQDPNYLRAAAPAEPQLIMPGQLASDDLEDENELLLVYPNPVKDTFTIKFGELNPTSVEIYDFSGKQILYKDISNDEKLLILDIRNYAPGMYLVRIHTANGVSVRKIMKE